MEKTIKAKKLTNYYLFTIFIILLLGFTINNIAYTEAASCSSGNVKPHWGCSSSGKCKQFDTCGKNYCDSDSDCSGYVTTTTTITTTKPSSTTTTTTGGAGNCESIRSNGAWTCWDTINNKP